MVGGILKGEMDACSYCVPARRGAFVCCLLWYTLPSRGRYAFPRFTDEEVQAGRWWLSVTQRVPTSRTELPSLVRSVTVSGPDGAGADLPAF